VLDALGSEHDPAAHPRTRGSAELRGRIDPDHRWHQCEVSGHPYGAVEKGGDRILLATTMLRKTCSVSSSIRSASSELSETSNWPYRVLRATCRPPGRRAGATREDRASPSHCGWLYPVVDSVLTWSPRPSLSALRTDPRPRLTPRDRRSRAQRRAPERLGQTGARAGTDERHDLLAARQEGPVSSGAE
jgi:hypothetical protein